MPAAAKASSCSAGDSELPMLAPIRPTRLRAPLIGLSPPPARGRRRGTAGRCADRPGCSAPYPRCASGPAPAPGRSRRSAAPALAFCSISRMVTPASRRSCRMREHLLHQQRREPDRRLVDQHQLGVEQQAARDLEQLLLAARQRRGLRVGLLAQHREARHHRVDARRRAPTGRRSATPPSSRLCRTDSSGKMLRPCGT